MRHVVHHVLQRHTTPGIAVVHRVLYHIFMWCSVVYSAMYTTTCVSVVCSMWCNTVMLRGLQYMLHCCSTVCTAGCVAPCCTTTCLASHRVHHLLSFTKCILCTCTCTCIQSFWALLPEFMRCGTYSYLNGGTFRVMRMELAAFTLATGHRGC